MNNVLIYSLIKKLSIRIDRLISSSQDSNPNIALGNLSNKIDTLKQNVDTKAKQETVNKVGRDLENIGSILSNKVDKVEKAINTKASQSSVTEVWQEIGDKAGTITRKIGTVEGKVDTKASQASVNKANDAIDALGLALGSLSEKGAVKRVQRGLLVVDWTTHLEEIKENGIYYYKRDIVLPYEVNLNKSLAFVKMAFKVTNNSDSYDISCQLVSSKTLRILSMKDSVGYVFTWQVIEYY